MASSENGGFFKVPNIVMDCEGLTGTEKLVLLSLLRHFNAEQQRAWPSIRLIAKEACISNFWTVETLKRLEKKGVIRTEKKWGCGTRYEVVTSQLSLLVNSVEQSTQLNTLCNSVEQCCATQLNGLCNSVEPNNTNEQDKLNKTKEQEGRLSSSDPWIRDQLAAIRQVVTAPRPAKLPELLAQWRETYGAQVVEQTIRKALRWMQDNGRQYTDMGRFIGNWLARDAKQPRPRNFTAPDYGDTPKSWRELMPAFFEEEQHDGQ